MFLNLLTQEQKPSFLAMAQKMILADGRITESEEAALAERVAEMGGDIQSPAEEVYGESNTAIFDTRRARMIVLMELHVLVFADGEFSEQEWAILQPILEAWKINEADLSMIRDWARKAALPERQGWDLLESFED
ncbi:hypothetical protein JCM17960_01800 [Magnetospira thiophila]